MTQILKKIARNLKVNIETANQEFEREYGQQASQNYNVSVDENTLEARRFGNDESGLLSQTLNVKIRQDVLKGDVPKNFEGMKIQDITDDIIEQISDHLWQMLTDFSPQPSLQKRANLSRR